MAELTVVMAHAGDSRFLRPALRSLQSQTLREFRVLLVDDASGVDLRQICAEFATLAVDVLHNEMPLGLARSLNRGLRACRTPFVARMDSDDISLPERLERQLAWLSQRPDVALLGTAVRYIDAAGRYQSRTFPLTEPEDVRLGLLAYNQLAHGSLMARTEALLAAGGYDENLQLSQDYELWLRLQRAGQRIANLPEPHYEQRLHAASASALRRRQQIAAARQARERAVMGSTGQELADFFASARDQARGRPYERLQLGKLGLFTAYLASRPGVSLGLRGRALSFAARHAGGAVSALRAEEAWRREWSRWLQMVVP